MNKRIKQLLGAGLFFLLFLSCTESKDYFFESNQQPSVLLKNGESYVSSLYTSHKYASNRPYKVIFKYIDDQSDYKFNIVNTSGTGELRISDSTLYYWPDTTGIHSMELTFTDLYNQSVECDIELDVFWNNPPVAIFSYTISGGILHVNAAESYDQDSSYGGEILNYKFILDGKEYILDYPNFSRNINTSILHVIKLQVQDNNYVWSNVVSDIIVTES